MIERIKELKKLEATLIQKLQLLNNDRQALNKLINDASIELLKLQGAIAERQEDEKRRDSKKNSNTRNKGK